MSFFLRHRFSPQLKALCCLTPFLFSSQTFASPTPTSVTQTKPKICVILDKGGKDDHSFNESAVKGFQKALKTLPIHPESKFVEPRNDAQIPSFLNNFATEVNCDLIVTVGFGPSDYLPSVAEKFPNKKFLAIDTNKENLDKKKNIRSITFEEHEGSFLVGAIAAMKSSSQSVGFIGGMDVPLIHRFELGYIAGAKFINPKIKTTSTFVGVTHDAWNNPSKAKELAISQYSSGVDVIFQVAAASGQGVFDAAEDLNSSQSHTKHFAIGVDSNENWINPKVILTSMEKRVDLALYKSIVDVVENKFTSGLMVMGLKEGGVLWSLDDNNKKFFSKKDIDKLNDIKQKIIDQKIIVPDYYKQK